MYYVRSSSVIQVPGESTLRRNFQQIQEGEGRRTPNPLYQQVQPFFSSNIDARAQPAPAAHAPSNRSSQLDPRASQQQLPDPRLSKQPEHSQQQQQQRSQQFLDPRASQMHQQQLHQQQIQQQQQQQYQQQHRPAVKSEEPPPSRQIQAPVRQDFHAAKADVRRPSPPESLLDRVRPAPRLDNHRPSSEFQHGGGRSSGGADQQQGGGGAHRQGGAPPQAKHPQQQQEPSRPSQVRQDNHNHRPTPAVSEQSSSAAAGGQLALIHRTAFIPPPVQQTTPMVEHSRHNQQTVPPAEVVYRPPAMQGKLIRKLSRYLSVGFKVFLKSKIDQYHT